MNLNSLITSSVDPNKVSFAVKGFLVLMAPAVMWYFGFTDMQFNELMDAIVGIVTWGTGLVGALMTLWGLYRKWREGRWSAPPNTD